MSTVRSFSYVDCWTPVTALHISGDFLFTGSGNKLELWSLDPSQRSSKPIATVRLMCQCSIHGILTKTIDNRLYVIVSGNRYLSVLRVDISTHFDNDFLLNYVKESILMDQWIVTVKSEHSFIYAVLTDNSFAIVCMNTWEILVKIPSPLKCIIYSSMILSISDGFNSVLLASGTPFKSTSVWYFKNGSVNVIANLENHEGCVIFIEYDYNSNILFTASDDRCINVWAHLDCSLTESNTWDSGKFILLHQLFSHTARIFSLTILDEYLVSCGENDEICVWSPASGTLILKANNSEGATLWCSTASQSQGMIYTGSNDSSVRRFSLKGRMTESNRVTGQCVHSVPKFIHYLREPFENSADVVCVTDDGRCALLDIKDNAIHTNKIFYLDQSFESYCVGCVSNLDMFYCANKFGYVRAISLRSMEEKYAFQAHFGKVLTCHIIDDTILLTSGFDGEVKFWSLDNCMGSFILDQGRHRWVTCLAFCGNHVFIGDANGSLTIVFLEDKMVPLETKRGVHDRHGINDLQFHPKFKQNLFSCGRDGKVIEYLWNGETLTTLRCIPLKVDFDWIERILFDCDNELTLVGFSSTNFVLWRQLDASRLWTVSCGGGHRLWDFAIVENSLHFSYYSNNELHFVSRALAPSEIGNPYIKAKFHSSKINCCHLLSYKNSVGLVATGGEDKNIILSAFDSYFVNLKNIDTCSGHISAVRGLASVKKYDGSILMVSVGGQSQLIVWSIQMRSEQKLVINQVFNNLVDERGHPRSQLTLEAFNEPISRYLSVNIVEANFGSEVYHISVTCSDSYVKIFTLSTDNIYALSLTKQIRVGDYAPLSLHRINQTLITGASDGLLKFWSIIDQPEAMDDIEMLDSLIDKLSLSVPTQKTSELKVHDSGINCIDSKLIKDNIWLIASSGDDTCLTLSLVRLNGDLVELIVQKKIDKIHCSQISVVSIFDDLSLLTCSTDQKIVLWNYSVPPSADDIMIEPILSNHISVADISSCCVINWGIERFLIITGVGIEILKVDP